MKSIARTLFLLLPVLASFSCTYSETAGITIPTGTLTLTPCVADMVPTRSQLTVKENRFSEASVAVYHGGGLFTSTYVTDMSAISFPYVHIGDTYTVYAAFNAGNLTFPVAESDLSALTVAWDTLSINTKGFPMTWSGAVTFSSDGQNVEMAATRMVSKITFSVSNTELTDHNGSFTASSVELKNSVRTAGVFDADIYGGDTSLSSDSATPDDITSVNNGSKISFYTFENLGSAVGGVSVSGSDPWGKVPDNMDGKGDSCTYLEVSGTYSTDGGTCTVPVTYKMYIGENATSNFDLVRNYVYDVILCPSDEGIDKTSWKITRGSFTDSRSLSFSPSSVTMNLGTNTTFTVTPSPSDMEYTVTGGTGWAESTLTLTATGRPDEYSLSSTGTLTADATTSVVATSWDGRVTALLPVTVKAKVLKSLALTPATVYKYTGETQTYTVTATYDEGGAELEEDVTSQAAFIVTGDKDVVTMNKNVATARNGGTVTITALYGGKEAEAQFNTRYPVSAVVKLADSTIPTGGSTTASTVVTYSGDGATKTCTTGSGLTYAFEPTTSYATFSGDTITAGDHHGDIYVKATYSEAGETVTSETVKLRIAEVTYQLSIDQGSLIKIGLKTYNLTCTLKTYWDGSVHSTEDGTNPAIWTESSSEKVVIVNNGDNKGRIIGQSYGTATVTATYKGESASISVEVVKPRFELKTTSSGATSSDPHCYIYVWLYRIDPFTLKTEAYTEVGAQCSFSGCDLPVQTSGGHAYMDFVGHAGSGSFTAGYTATYEGDAGGGVVYDTQTVRGTCSYTE